MSLAAARATRAREAAGKEAAVEVKVVDRQAAEVKVEDRPEVAEVATLVVAAVQVDSSKKSLSEVTRS